MNKVSFKEIEAITERLKAQNGQCVMMVNNGESDNTQCVIIAHNKNTFANMMIDFFRVNQELIPAAMHALAIAMECDGDCDNCDYNCDDDDENVCMN